MAEADRVYIALRGDEERPFVQVHLRKNYEERVEAELSWAGPPPADGYIWPHSGPPPRILDWAARYCAQNGYELRIVLIGEAKWNPEWGWLE